MDKCSHEHYLEFSINFNDKISKSLLDLSLIIAGDDVTNVGAGLCILAAALEHNRVNVIIGIGFNCDPLPDRLTQDGYGW